MTKLEPVSRVCVDEVDRYFSSSTYSCREVYNVQGSMHGSNYVAAESNRLQTIHNIALKETSD